VLSSESEGVAMLVIMAGTFALACLPQLSQWLDAQNALFNPV
jgi:hypothetical protein